jgi:putative Mg2+ transporter-C (MgtC) family protein
MDPIVDFVVKLGLTLVLSGIIGLEREVTGHKAGIRTLILVGIGAASFVMLTEQINIPESETGRIIAGVATGIGFLGAGAIMKEGINVRGLTTAATIWVTASIGVAIGTGAFEIGLITFSFTIIVLSIFGILERKFNLKANSGTLQICMKKGYELPKLELRAIERSGIGFSRIEVDRYEEGVCVNIDVDLPRNIGVTEFTDRVSSIKGTRKVQWEDTDLKGSSTYLDRFS